MNQASRSGRPSTSRVSIEATPAGPLIEPRPAWLIRCRGCRGGHRSWPPVGSRGPGFDRHSRRRSSIIRSAIQGSDSRGIRSSGQIVGGKLWWPHTDVRCRKRAIQPAGGAARSGHNGRLLLGTVRKYMSRNRRFQLRCLRSRLSVVECLQPVFGVPHSTEPVGRGRPSRTLP